MRKLAGRIVFRLTFVAVVIAASASSSPRATAAAQVAAAAPGEVACGDSWESYTFGGEEFAVSLPEMPALDHGARTVRESRRQEPVRAYGAYGDGVVYLMRAYDRPQPDEDAAFFARYYASSVGFSNKPVTLTSAGETTLGGRRYSFLIDVKPESVPMSSLRVYVTRRHAYVLRVVGAGDEHPCARRFFDSFKLSDSPAGRQIVDAWKSLPEPADTPEAAANGVAPERKQTPDGDLKAKTESSGAGVGRGVGPGEGLGTGVGPGRGVGPGEAAQGGGGMLVPKAGPVDYNRTFMAREVTRKAIVVSRPEPPYSERARKNQIAGTVMLRLILNSNGMVTNIATISRRLPDGLTERAILAARHLKFIPAEKDGRRVSQYATIQYNFNIY